MDKVVHFEIPTDDIARATGFYRSIFGWDLQDMSGQGMDYTIAMTVPVDDQQMPTERGAINGGMMKRSDDTPSPVITIEVASIDDAMKRIEDGGGSVVHPREEIPGMGAFAYFKDSEGNTMGLWESAH
jgi:predicted enzyme related to lactoylglutathione lyase